MQPDLRLTLSSPLWADLLRELHRRTEGSHESGAFLLGRSVNATRTVHQIVFYDDLDPTAYRTGICILEAPSFGQLWSRCRASELSVVADVHVHPKGAGQSRADRMNPMIARTGHLAIIVPYFATPPVRLSTLGLYHYEGSHQWRDLGGPQIGTYLRIGGETS